MSRYSFAPRDADLVEVYTGLEAEEPDGLPTLRPLREVQAPEPGVPTVFLITEEDCCAEDFELTGVDLTGVASLAASHLRSSLPVAQGVVDFETAALADAVTRFGRPATGLRAGVPEDLARWADRKGARQIVTPYVPVGPLRDWLDEARPALDAAGIRLTEWRRDWDAAIWPSATAGFFKVKKQIPAILHEAGLS